MRKSKFGFITASAAASLVVSESNFEPVSTERVFPVSDTTTLNTGIENLPDITSSEINFQIQRVIPAPGVERWSQFEKRRYKKLVVKFAISELSETEKQELDSLETARSRFEDERTLEEIIAEFRSRENYAALLTSLKNASLGGNTA